MTNLIRPRRSVLYVPGTNERALAKAKSLDIDALIFDLEDSVAPEQKQLAREQVVNCVCAGEYGHRELIVRINGLETLWGDEDLQAVIGANPDAILVPKIYESGDIVKIDSRISEIAANSDVKIWAMMETPCAMLNAKDIASEASRDSSKLSAFVMGTNDLAKDTGAALSNHRIAMIPWLMTCIAAARSYGLAIIDGVYNDFSNAAGFADECRQGADFGMDGKTLIHPNQISPCNEVFSPTDESIEWARKIIGAFGQPENADKGVIRLEGKMVERLHMEIAKKTVAIADSIENRQ